MTDASDRAKGDPRGRIPFYYPLLVAGLVLLLAVAGMAYLWTMRNLFPAMELARIPTAEERGEPPVREGPRRRLRLIQPASNIACAEQQSFDLWSQVERWSELSAALGFASEVGGIGRVPATPAVIDAIVVPWVLCLSEEERHAIDEYARAGGGVILAGAAGLSGDAPEPFSADALFVVPGGRTAAASALDPGRRLEIPRDSPAFSHRSEHPMLWWSGWQLKPTPEHSSDWRAAAAVRGGASRQAWFGFPVNHAAPGSEAELDRMRSLALQWVAGDDVVAVAPWPDGRRFAWVVSLDAHGEEPEMEAALDASEALGLRSTVFVYSDVAKSRLPLRKALRASAELGSRGDRRTRFEGGTRIHQKQKLASSRAAISRIQGREVRGLRIPRERLDALTMHEASEAGYRYVVGDPDFDRAYPRWVSAEGSPMALISRAASADDSAGPRRVAPDQLLRDMQRMRGLGGLWVLTLSGPGLSDPERRATLAPVMRRAASADPWMATAGETVEWVRQRAQLEFEVSSSGLLRIANPGVAPLEGLVIEIYGNRLEPTRRAVPRLAARGAAALQLGDGGIALAPSRPLPLLAADGRRLAEDEPRGSTPSFARR
ncbi:MAG: polysaccharide deacetylase family protein [bacterium]|nr:polysaccharide deacetylase family protein [bacterium]